MNPKIKAVLSEAHRYYHNCRDLKVYEMYKFLIDKRAESAAEYEEAIIKLAGILKV